MAYTRKLYVLTLIAVFSYTIITSYMKVLQEPTAFNEIELENYASFPSMTICERPFVKDTFHNFTDVNLSIQNFYDNIEAKLCHRIIENSTRYSINSTFEFSRQNSTVI